MTKSKWYIYWIATGLLSFGMLGSGISQILHLEGMMQVMEPLGYPSFFLTIIGVWKVLAVITILLPGFKLLKEWAYAGLFFVMTGAFMSQLAVGNGVAELIGPFFQTLFIILSWYYRPEDRKFESTN